jgi:glycosyltransferase involved in cell wall biosynthesis
MGFLTGSVFSLVIPAMRRWDLQSSRGVDRFIAISKVVAERISRHYGRKSDVIYPPVDVEYFSALDREEGDYVLYLGRLVPYKRPDIALLAARNLDIPIKFVGEGPELTTLREIGYAKADFLGFLERDQLREVLSGARALIFPPEEDFGITPLEATAAGVPVAAYGAGGATETIIEGVTGEFFREQNPASATEALRRVLKLEMDRDACLRHASKFDAERFKREINLYVNESWEKFGSEGQLLPS